MSLLAMVEEKMKRHRCRRCNKPLTDEESIELGIGPICRLKESLEYDDWWGVVEFCCMGGSGFSTTTKLNMNDMDKYEGAEEVYLCEKMWKSRTDVISKETNLPIALIYCGDSVRSHNPTPAQHILMDAFKLHRASKKMHDGICRIIGQVEVDPDEYTKEGILLMLKELIAEH